MVKLVVCITDDDLSKRLPVIVTNCCLPYEFKSSSSSKSNRWLTLNITSTLILAGLFQIPSLKTTAIDAWCSSNSSSVEFLLSFLKQTSEYQRTICNLLQDLLAFLSDLSKSCALLRYSKIWIWITHQFHATAETLFSAYLQRSD